jgi:hypothetical protein
MKSKARRCRNFHFLPRVGADSLANDKSICDMRDELRFVHSD